MLRVARALLLALTTTVGAVLPFAAGAEVTLDAVATRQVGFVLLKAGNAQGALEIAEALLRRDPDDPVALILKSRAARDLGQYDVARQAARAAWTAAETDGHRYGAAMSLAQAQSSAGRKTFAQLWLRRAAQIAPSPEARDIAIRDLDYVRTRNPVKLELEFGISPSSNINGGSSSSVIEILGLPFTLSGDARALSGVEAAAGVTARFRRPLRAQSATEYRFSAMGRHYWLSSEAKAQAPDAKGSDYDFGAVEAGWSTRFSPDGSELKYDVGGTIGRNWYGGDVLSDYVKLEFGVQKSLSPELLGHARVTAEHQERRDNPDRSADILGFSAGLVRQMSNRDQIGFSLGARNTMSDAAAIEHTALLASAFWERDRPVAGVRIGASLAAETRHYQVYPFSPDGRDDLTLTASLSLTFERAEYMGFAPVLNLRASRTDSSMALFDTSDIGIGLGIETSF